MDKLSFEHVLERIVIKKIKSNLTDMDLTSYVLKWTLENDNKIRFNVECIFNNRCSLAEYIIGYISDDGEIVYWYESDLLKSRLMNDVIIQIEGYVGTWKILKSGYCNGLNAYLLEHEQYGNNVPYLVVDTAFGRICQTDNASDVLCQTIKQI